MLASQRDLFTIPDDVHYLNCAYMSPLLKSVETAGIEGVRRKSAPWAIGAADFYDPAETLRERAGQLINAPAERICLIPAASYGAAIAGAALPLAKGQNVVLPAEEFPSVVYVWRERCRQTGAQVRTVPRPQDTNRPGTRWSERMLEAIDNDTAAVALTAIHWTDGTPFDLAAIGARAREVGAAFIVDGTQSVGALPLDFQQVQPDFLYCASYKWLMGPYSLGFAAVGDRFMDAEPLEYNWIARKDSENFAALIDYTDDYQPGARRFDVGERSNFALVPMLNAALAQLLEWTPEAIRTYCAGLGDYLQSQLAESPYMIAAPDQRTAHLFGVRVPDASVLPAIQQALTARWVHVSLRGTAIRVSPHVYNTESDLGALAEALRAALP